MLTLTNFADQSRVNPLIGKMHKKIDFLYPLLDLHCPLPAFQGFRFEEKLASDPSSRPVKGNLTKFFPESRNRLLLDKCSLVMLIFKSLCEKYRYLIDPYYFSKLSSLPILYNLFHANISSPNGSLPRTSGHTGQTTCAFSNCDRFWLLLYLLTSVLIPWKVQVYGEYLYVKGLTGTMVQVNSVVWFLWFTVFLGTKCVKPWKNVPWKCPLEPEAVLHRCSYKKMFWKHAANLQDSTHTEGSRITSMTLKK